MPTFAASSIRRRRKHAAIIVLSHIVNHTKIT